MRRFAVWMMCVLLLAGVAWWARGGSSAERRSANWHEVESGVWRSNGLPCGYALIDGDSALLIGAARNVDWRGLSSLGVKRIDRCLLTHHHRDTSALAGDLIQAGIQVQAPKASAEWLSSDGVQRFWKACLPELVPGREPDLKDRTFNAFAYLVHPRGFAEIDCSLEDGQAIRSEER